MTGSVSMMDKNKSAHKFKGVPHIYWINLDSDDERRQYMEEQFEYWEIKNHTRISGYDGREDDVTEHLKGKFPDFMNMNEVACCMSHLKALKKFYYETEDEYCIIAEDDVDLHIAKYWSFSWVEFFALLPHDWDAIQMTTICTGDIHIRLHRKFINDFSAAFYLITRHHAGKILRTHCRGEQYKLDQNIKPRAVSEDVILETGKVYTIPIVLYNLKFPSGIHQEHIGYFHKSPHSALLNYWESAGSQMSIQEQMNYDPYLGTTTENSTQPFKSDDVTPTNGQGSTY